MSRRTQGQAGRADGARGTALGTLGAGVEAKCPRPPTPPLTDVKENNKKTVTWVAHFFVFFQQMSEVRLELLWPIRNSPDRTGRLGKCF